MPFNIINTEFIKAFSFNLGLNVLNIYLSFYFVKERMLVTNPLCTGMVRS